MLESLREPVAGDASAVKAAQEQKLADAEAKSAQETTDPSKVLIRWVAKLGAGIVSGLGLAGVVSLIGAAVLMVRFEQAGLPATQALEAVPDSQLTVEGATGLIAALLIASLAVITMFSLDRTGQLTKGSAAALFLLWAGGVCYTIFCTDLDAGRVLLLALLGLVLVGASVGIGKVTGSLYVPFAAAVFVSTVVFAGAVNIAIATQQNFIQPAAVLRSPEGLGIRGFYVGDTDDFIYLGVIREGSIPKEPGDGVPLYKISRDEETRLLIGKLQSFDDAVERTEQLRKQLKATERKDDPAPEKVVE